jgi:hypothetical protein
MNKSIDINQRIPLDTLEATLISYLNENYSSEYVIEQLSLDFKGENRLKKGLRIVNKIVINNPLSIKIIQEKHLIRSALKINNDRNVILIALFNSAFPFAFNTLRTLGNLFSAQDVLSREALRKQLSKLYGGNRSTENAIDCVIPMFLEAGLFNRPKPGLYESKAPLAISSGIAKRLFTASFLINNSATELHEYQLMDPYFSFVG